MRKPVLALCGMLVLCDVLASCSPAMGSVGAMLGKHNVTGRVTIREAPAGMGAAEAGLLPGDEVLLVDGRDVRKMTPEQVHHALVGPVGTKVAVTVVRDGRIVRVDVARGKLR